MLTFLVATALSFTPSDIDDKRVVGQKSPDQLPQQKHQSNLVWLDFYYDFGNGKKLLETLSQMPEGTWQSLGLRRSVMSQYLDLIANTVGVDEAIGVLDRMSAKPVVDHKAFAKKSYDRTEEIRVKTGGKPSKLTKEEALAVMEKRSIERGRDIDFELVEKKAELLAFNRRVNEATNTLDEFIKTVPTETHLHRRVSARRSQFAMIGQPAPELVSQPISGSFPGLINLKGKVVILHVGRSPADNPWRELTSKVSGLYIDLFPKGLEMVTAVTGADFRPHIESVNRDIERLKIGWPVVEGKTLGSEPVRSLYTDAQVIGIDREGIVRFVQTGYSAHREGLIAFKARVERLLKVK